MILEHDFVREYSIVMKNKDTSKLNLFCHIPSHFYLKKRTLTDAHKIYMCDYKCQIKRGEEQSI